MIVLIDNYDSFTYNVVQYFEILGVNLQVYKNDDIKIDEIEKLNPDAIVISPGPNSPNESGISISVIEYFHTKLPILGICLGHQCIAQFFGAKIISAHEIIHGKTSEISHNSQGLFKKIPPKFNATRYHSLCVDPKTLSKDLQIDAWSGDIIMALSHKSLPIYGVQFHPEAILTECGLDILQNFLDII